MDTYRTTLYLKHLETGDLFAFLGEDDVYMKLHPHPNDWKDEIVRAVSLFGGVGSNLGHVYLFKYNEAYIPVMGDVILKGKRKWHLIST